MPIFLCKLVQTTIELYIRWWIFPIFNKNKLDWRDACDRRPNVQYLQYWHLNLMYICIQKVREIMISFEMGYSHFLEYPSPQECMIQRAPSFLLKRYRVCWNRYVLYILNNSLLLIYTWLGLFLREQFKINFRLVFFFT